MPSPHRPVISLVTAPDPPVLPPQFCSGWPIADSGALYREPWRLVYGFLLAAGYEIARDMSKPNNEFDIIHPLSPSVIQGSELATGKDIFIKAVGCNSSELAIMRTLTQPHLRVDPRNHTIPIVDFVQLGPITFIITYEVGEFYSDPPFNHKEQVFHFISTVLEGVEFMHEHSIAHMDISSGNILFDDGTDRRKTRGTPRSPHNLGQYYFIDFEFSWMRKDPSQTATTILGRTYSAPEGKIGDEVDPFALDVHDMGRVFKAAIKTSRGNVPGFGPSRTLDSLINRMMCEEPTRRPTAAEARKQFEADRSQILAECSCN